LQFVLHHGKHQLQLHQLALPQLITTLTQSHVIHVSHQSSLNNPQHHIVIVLQDDNWIYHIHTFQPPHHVQSHEAHAPHHTITTFAILTGFSLKNAQLSVNV
jgi:hypothetical protein